MKVVKWTGNSQLYEMVKELNDKIYMVGHKAINNEKSTRDMESLEEHRRIIEALKNNDILAAKNLMILHIVETRRNLIKNFL
ncbi:MAG: FCD domain-containing protein [Fusobacterium sp.]|uniref:FCD domain-containing protein n=1 Tax=Fusobacterium sp. TaxID=68766 RepID=UPI0026DBA680|nr:FCD domain-containing protein [Fusobacterium sp.]MDO4690142.1 FCD domain-containing protein [Fusobacterium sp.]